MQAEDYKINLQRKKAKAFYIDIESVVTLEALSSIYQHSESEIIEVAIKFLYSNYYTQNVTLKWGESLRHSP